MTPQPRPRFFTLQLADGRSWPGIQFPSGHVAVNHPDEPLAFTIAISLDGLLDGTGRVPEPLADARVVMGNDDHALYESAERDVLAVQALIEHWSTVAPPTHARRDLEATLNAARAGHPEPSWYCPTCGEGGPRTERHYHHPRP
ncbi:hypothetical protein ACFXHD_13770, partial [Streptomyces hydrogenans]|uniref:hypothetical protein n=1 Tax=Streptomyces hydrogenans TaxID=1873719 RepID=UPI0036BEAB2A